MKIEDLSIQSQLIAGIIALPAFVVEMNGTEDFKAIRNDSHLEHVPAIASTTSVLTSHRKLIPAHGFNVNIPNPIDKKVFLETQETTLYGK